MEKEDRQGTHAETIARELSPAACVTSRTGGPYEVARNSGEATS